MANKRTDKKSNGKNFKTNPLIADTAAELLNYKGIYAENNEDEAKYTCPVTGAHFEYNDMCRRIKT